MFLKLSRRFDFSTRSLGHVMFSFAGTAQAVGAGGRSGAAGIPVRGFSNIATACYPAFSFHSQCKPYMQILSSCSWLTSENRSKIPRQSVAGLTWPPL